MSKTFLSKNLLGAASLLFLTFATATAALGAETVTGQLTLNPGARMPVLTTEGGSENLINGTVDLTLQYEGYWGAITNSRALILQQNGVSAKILVSSDEAPGVSGFNQMQSTDDAGQNFAIESTTKVEVLSQTQAIESRFCTMPNSSMKSCGTDSDGTFSCGSARHENFISSQGIQECLVENVESESTTLIRIYDSESNAEIGKILLPSKTQRRSKVLEIRTLCKKSGSL